MAKPKTERNKLIIELYNQGKVDREILAGLLKAGFDDYQKAKSVTMQISRLRKAGKIPIKRPVSKEKRKKLKQQPGKVYKKEQIKTLKQENIKKGIGKDYLPVTYYITEEMKWEVKSLAAQRRQKVSELIRNILTDYLENV